jgi:hypothetical protein
MRGNGTGEAYVGWAAPAEAAACSVPPVRRRCHHEPGDRWPPALALDGLATGVHQAAHAARPEKAEETEEAREPKNRRRPRFGPAGHPLLDFHRQVGIAELAGALLRPGLGLEEPDFAQVTTTVPPWPHRPGGPHVDGLTPPAPDGRPGTFSMPAGVWLTDQRQQQRGNLWVV